REQIGVDAEPGSSALTREAGSAFSELPQTVGHGIRLVDDSRYPIVERILGSEVSLNKSVPTAEFRIHLLKKIQRDPIVRVEECEGSIDLTVACFGICQDSFDPRAHGGSLFSVRSRRYKEPGTAHSTS